MTTPQPIQQPTQNLEKKVQSTPTLGAKVVDVLGAFPPILGCTAGAYLLSFSDCVSQVGQALPNGLNVGYHLAAGSGLYGGYTSKANRKVASLATLAISMTPDLLMLSQDGDLKNLGTAVGVKVVGYGLGYIVGHFFG